MSAVVAVTATTDSRVPEGVTPAGSQPDFGWPDFGSNVMATPFMQ